MIVMRLKYYQRERKRAKKEFLVEFQLWWL
jgi:hypothetical protein